MMSFSLDWHELSMQWMTTMGHFLWQGLVVAVLLWTVDRWLASREQAESNSPQHSQHIQRAGSLRHALALIAFFSLPAMVVASFLWVHSSRPSIWITAMEAETKSGAASSSSVPTTDSKTDAGQPSVLDRPDPSLRSLTTTPSPFSPVGSLAQAIQQPSPGPRWKAIAGQASPYLFVTYCLGVTILLTRFMLSLLASGRQKKSLTPVTATPLLDQIARLSNRFGIKRPPLAMWCSEIPVPRVVGVFKPMILIPPAILSGLDSQQLAAILSHELAHVRRHDLLINVIQRLVEALLFFHPVTWWLSRHLSFRREICCDDIASQDHGRISYASALLRLAEQCALQRGLVLQPQLESLAADGFSDSQLGHRIRRLLGESETPPISLRWTPLVLLLGFIAIGMSVAVYARSNPNPSPFTNLPSHDQSLETETSDPKSIYEGVVLAPDGTLFTGASIYLIPYGRQLGDLGKARAVTDEQGRFSFQAKDMTYQRWGKTLRREGLIVASAKEYAGDWMVIWGDNTSKFIESWTPRPNAPIELQLAKPGNPIRGQFVDSTGKPVAGANVAITNLMIPKNQDLDAHLEHWSKANVSAGFLTRAPDYKRELGQPNVLPNLTTETTTDSEGRFEIHNIGKDRLVRLQVRSPTTVDTSLEVMTRDGQDVGTFLMDDGTPTRIVHGANINFQLQPGLTVHGRVLDQTTRQPIPGMWVTRYHNPLLSPGQSTGMDVTDSEGRFTITGLPTSFLKRSADRRFVTAIPQPGIPYLTARGTVEKDQEVVIECVKGIPYQLKLTDESGQPVKGIVEYQPLHPNPLSDPMVKPLRSHSNWPVMNRAVRRPDGTYQGFVLPGPGAVLIKTPGRNDQPTSVNPKAFFAPEKTWNDIAFSQYGTGNSLSTGHSWLDQRAYSAIVLVDPPSQSNPLQLQATVYAEQPREVRLLDTEGRPVPGATMKLHRWHGMADLDVPLEKPTVLLQSLQRNRKQRITFVHPSRKLVGYVDASTDSNTPLSVVMRPWATITGKLVNEEGDPIRVKFRTGLGPKIKNLDPKGSQYLRHAIDRGSSFRIEGLFPEQSYQIDGVSLRRGKLIPTALPAEEIRLREGEVFDLGEISVSDKVTRLVQARIPKNNVRVRSLTENKGSQKDPSFPGLKEVHWSSPSADGWRTGIQIVQLPTKEKPQLVIQNFLLNQTDRSRTVQLSIHGRGDQRMRLESGKRLAANLTGGSWEEEHTVGAKSVFTQEHWQAKFDLRGLQSGTYSVRIGPAFFLPVKGRVGQRTGLPSVPTISVPIETDHPSWQESPPTQLTGSPSTGLANESIHWGTPTGGLRVGLGWANSSGDRVKRLRQGDSGVAMLYVQNVASQPMEVQCILPHPNDGWGINIETEDGINVARHSIRVSTFSPMQAFDFTLEPGGTQTVTSPHSDRANSFSPVVDLKKIRPIEFLVAKNSPDEREIHPPFTYALEAGKHSIRCFVRLRRKDLPGVDLLPESGRVPFTVTDLSRHEPAEQSSAKPVKYPHCLVDIENLSERTIGDAIQTFNTESQESPIGRHESPISAMEVLDAARAFMTQPHVPDEVRTSITEILESKRLPSHVYFRRFTRYDDGKRMNRVWWVRLVVAYDSAPNYSIPVRTKHISSRPYTQMEREQNAEEGTTLLGRFSSYFPMQPKVVSLNEIPQVSADRFITDLKAILTRDGADPQLTQSLGELFHGKASRASTRRFAMEELTGLRGQSIESIQFVPRTIREELAHWCGYQSYRPNLTVVGHVEIQYRLAEHPNAEAHTLSLEVGQVSNELRLVNYVNHGQATPPKKIVQGLSITGNLEPLGEGNYLITSMTTNPDTLLSAHLANEEIWKRRF